MENELIATLVTVLTMGLYGSTYLSDVLRRHNNRAPLHFMAGQFVAMWAIQSLLHSHYGHTLLNAIWLGALFSAGSTIIGKVSCWAYMKDEEKKRQKDTHLKTTDGK